MKRTIEIDDTLDETLESAKDDVTREYAEFREANPDTDPTLDAWEPHDRIFEIADSSTPIYTSEIDGLYYLYGSEFEDAYRDAGIGDGGEDNHKAVAIFCYIEAALFDHARSICETGSEEWNDAQAETDEDSPEASS